MFYLLHLDNTCLVNNIDHPGNDLNGGCITQPNSWKRESPEECQILCKETDGCEIFSWIAPNNPWTDGRKRCCLKHSANPSPVTNEGVVSGAKSCGKYNPTNYLKYVMQFNEKNRLL